MKFILPGFVLLLFLLAGCSKKGNVIPTKPIDTGTVSPSTFSLAKVLQNNMVIQRDKPFTIWGTYLANKNITVKVSWNSTTFKAVSDASGNWSVTVPASGANASPQTITAGANGADDIVLTNILIGDVWLCAGQSNMVMPVDSIAPFRGVLNYKAEIAAANYPMIRTFAAREDEEISPLAEFKLVNKWQICSPPTVGPVSAVAYYFARKLNTTLDVPVGIIVSAINGSYCQEWTNVDAIQNDSYLAANYLSGSAGAYNGMISPLTKLSLKGYLWYQGENNQHDNPPSGYTRLNAAMINGWRIKFNQPALPFYFVQLTPFAEDYNSTTPPGGDLTSDYLAKFREAQANVLTVNGTGMAVTMDVGEAANHHPQNKKPVGERLALLALKNTYGQNVQCYGPHFESFSVSNYTATVNFSAGTAAGLNTINGAPLKQYFFVAGIDQIFRQGTATISGSTIIIQAPAETPLPIQAVRYAFTNAPVTNLRNSAGLPAEPFRTDNWDN